jgi:molybdate transport system substrate-binding protein
VNRLLLVSFALILFAGQALAAEIHVVSSGGFAAAYKQLAPEFEKQTGNSLDSAWGPSMGDTHDAVPQRLARGEPIDVVIMVGYALDQLVQQGKVIPDSRKALARSLIGIAVKAGAPKPDVSTPEALKDALLKAKSIAYSDSASGVYVQNVLLNKLGISEQVRGKAHMIPAEPVGQIVARGDAEIGFQQISELKPVDGIDIIGPLPDSLQQITIFSAGIPVGAKQPEAGKQLIDFLASPAAAGAIKYSGMEPIATEKG